MEKRKIAVIGLGYVGLPLARLFSTKFSTIGFDINTERVAELNLGKDSTCELSQELLQKAIKEGFRCTSMQEDIAESNFYVIAVPTPVDKEKRPDFKALFSATELVAKVLKKGDIVVYESTVYPGVTEEKCVPILQKISGLEYNKEFFVGYSPERINPGDKQHTVEKIKKVVSASNSVALKEVERVYTSVIEAGVHLVGSIKVAEAAKVIENSQRDINIAFVNELAKIFALVGIDTTEVLEAASTKWNFLPFKPGLVGGHCIGVDPYYLAECAERYGYNPQVILSGRRINDSMGEYVAMRVIKLMLNSGIEILHSKVLILGFTFKENCTDIRNTKVYDIYKTLREYEIEVDIYDSWADRQEVSKEYEISLDNILSSKDLESFNNEKIEQKNSERVLEGDRFFKGESVKRERGEGEGEGEGVEGERVLSKEKYDGVILAVAHKDFLNINIDNLVKDKHIVFDIKSLLPQSKTYRL